jgi:hypothetical protein
MAHAASKEHGHGVKFFAQMERLMKKGAPVTVGSPEAGRVTILGDVVPRRFPLLRARMERAENRRALSVWKTAREDRIKINAITDDMIVRWFEDAALELPWKRALVLVGCENGLTDELGRPLNAWARNIVRRAKRVHRQARRGYLQSKKLESAFLGASWPRA